MPPSSITASRQPSAPTTAAISGTVGPNGREPRAVPAASNRVSATRSRPSRSAPIASRASRWARSTPDPGVASWGGISPSRRRRTGYDWNASTAEPLPSAGISFTGTKRARPSERTQNAIESAPIAGSCSTVPFLTSHPHGWPPVNCPAFTPRTAPAGRRSSDQSGSVPASRLALTSSRRSRAESRRTRTICKRHASPVPPSASSPSSIPAAAGRQTTAIATAGSAALHAAGALVESHQGTHRAPLSASSFDHGNPAARTGRQTGTRQAAAVSVTAHHLGQPRRDRAFTQLSSG